MHQVRERCSHDLISHDFLKDQRAVIQITLERRLHDENQHKADRERLVFPNVKGHDPVGNPFLDKDERDQQHEPNEKHGEGLGTSPSCLHAGGDVVNHTDNA